MAEWDRWYKCGREDKQRRAIRPGLTGLSSVKQPIPRKNLKEQ
jgi:hypothetical protein